MKFILLKVFQRLPQHIIPASRHLRARYQCRHVPRLYHVRNSTRSLSSCPSSLGTQQLVEESKDLLSRNDGSSTAFQRERVKLLTQWQHELFRISSAEKRELVSVASVIHDLVQGYLEDSSIRNRTSTRHDDLTLEFVCTSVFAWGRVASFDRRAPQRAEEMVQRVLDGMDNSKDVALAKVFSSLSYCWSQELTSEESALRAKEWMDSILQLPGQPLTIVTVNNVLQAFGRLGKIERIFEILREVEDRSIHANAATYETLIRGHLESGSAEGPKWAYQTLQKAIENLHNSDQEDASALSQLIARYMNMRRKDPEAVERVLKQLVALETSKSAASLLQTRHFTIAVAAWASKGNSQRALELFSSFEKLQKSGEIDLESSTKMFSSVVTSMAKRRSIKGLVAASNLLTDAEVLFEQSSDEVSWNYAYNAVLDALATTPGVSNRTQRIRDLLHRMEELALKHQNNSLRPDKISYTSLLRGIISEMPPDAEEQVTAVLETMETSSIPAIHPDVVTYTQVFEFFLKSPNERSLEIAQRLKNRMQKQSASDMSQVRMDATIFTTLIKLCTQTRDVRLSDSYLKAMIREYENGVEECRPTELAFLAAIGGWERSGRRDSYDGALRLYNRMIELYQGGNSQCRPSQKVFGELMWILAKSGQPSSIERADRLLFEMKKFEIVPDRLLLNFYLRVCSIRQIDRASKDAALGKAQSVFASLQETGQADSNTYVSMLHAGHNHVETDDERTKFLVAIASQVPVDLPGYEKVNRALRDMLAPSVYEDMMASKPEEIGESY